MNAAQRRELARLELVEELTLEAAAKNLRIECRGGVWNAIDTRTDMVSVRGVSLEVMAAYIRRGAAAVAS